MKRALAKASSQRAHALMNASTKNERSSKAEVEAVLASLKRLGTKHTRDEMLRYGIHASKAFGVQVGAMQTLAKRLGHNHELALALWKTGWYEARMVAAFVDQPERVTPAQMDRGAATSTIGASATPFAFTCSTARRMPSARSRNGPAHATSSLSVGPLRC